MMRSYVNLREDEREALIKLAELERRYPADQAALIIRRELERLGLLPVLQVPTGTAGEIASGGAYDSNLQTK